MSRDRPARTIDVAERRARLAARHRLAPRHRGRAPDEVARSVVALHATDPPSVHLAVAARLDRPSVETVERALYDDRTIVRILGMRRTMFVVPVEAVGVVHASSTRTVAARERRRLAGYLEAAGVDDGSAWIDRAGDDVLRVLRERGEATTADLSAAVPALAQRIEAGAGTRWAVESTAASRLVALLAAEERVVRGRPLGPWWRGNPNRWAPLEAWAPGAAVPDDLDPAAAQARLATWWLRAFGPGTLDDLAWWTGWTRTATRAAVRAVGAVEVDLGGETGLVLPDDVDPAPAVEPWVALLPALDPTAMGWKGRDWYLGPHRAALFDRNGNVGPTIWSDGRVVGGWAQRPDGTVAFRLLEDVGAEAAASAETAAARLAALLGEARVVPRFRTPLERDLVAA